MSDSALHPKTLELLREIKACGDIPRVSVGHRVAQKLEQDGLVEQFPVASRRSREGEHQKVIMHLRLTAAGEAALGGVP